MGITLSNHNHLTHKDQDPRIHMAITIYNSYKIGFHTSKLPKLADSIRILADYSRPYQIFLGNPQSAKISISDEDIALSTRIVNITGANIFVHSPYIINLCNPPSWQITSLRKNLEYSSSIGFKGVVVHVGKLCGKYTSTDGITNMRNNIISLLHYASPDCPLILETPAGQGTETLTDIDQFIDFILSIDDSRFGFCIDTCHTFASGYCPFSYIQRCLHTPLIQPKLKIVHFNDSKTPCGSKKDRHEYIGMGHIGIGKMGDIAELCHSNHIPMVVE